MDIARQIQGEILADIFNGLGEKEILKKYSISSTEFLALKDSLLKQIKEKAGDAEITTHAARYFRNLAKECKFTETAKNLGLSEARIKFLNQIILGKVRPTYGIIFSLRRFISPAQWVFKEDEELPAPVSFRPLVEEKFPVYNMEARTELSTRKSLGHIYFDAIKEGHVLSKFCAVHNCPAAEIANVIYMKKHPTEDRRCLKRPAVPFITKFRTDIHPDFWFIYPDEVSQDILRKISLSAGEWVARLRGY